MNDRQQRIEQLLEYFGCRELPEAVRKELEADPELQAEWEKVHTLEEVVPAEEAFAFSDSDVAKMCEAVDQTIDQRDATQPESIIERLTPMWQRVVAVAATLALVVIASLLMNRGGGLEQWSGAISSEQVYEEILDQYVVETTEAEVSDPMYDAIIYEYTDDVTAESATMLLDDLTEEEFEYLNDNFDVNELLL